MSQGKSEVVELKELVTQLESGTHSMRMLHRIEELEDSLVRNNESKKEIVA